MNKSLWNCLVFTMLIASPAAAQVVKSATPAPVATPATTTPETATPVPNLLTSSTSRGPIEITSDELEVRQPEHIAIFTGNVLAIQDALNLKADRMKVFYRPSEEQTEGQESITKIEVDGNVFLANPTETARGLRGIYDVDANEIRLLGDVILTRAENILKGDALIYNMTTGKSVLTNSGTPAVKGKPDRVRALFVPSKKEGQ